eukprot:82446-Rhodomonas_salina.1
MLLPGADAGGSYPLVPCYVFPTRIILCIPTHIMLCIPYAMSSTEVSCGTARLRKSLKRLTTTSLGRWTVVKSRSICLRARYAMPGTDGVHGTTSAICLRTCYAMSSTDRAYSPTRKSLSYPRIREAIGGSVRRKLKRREFLSVASYMLLCQRDQYHAPQLKEHKLARLSYAIKDPGAARSLRPLYRPTLSPYAVVIRRCCRPTISA